MKSKIFFTLISVIATITTAGAVNVGDKVTLSETASTYATGERIPQRFLGKTYTVQQVGSKQHPDGVLLQEIYSWVKVADVPVATKEQEKNVLHIADSNIDKLGRRYVILYDTVIKVVTDTLILRDTVYRDRKVEFNIDTVLKVNRKVIIQYDTMFVDGGTKWQSKDTVYIVKTDTTNVTAQTRIDSTALKGFDRIAVGLRGGAAANTFTEQNYSWKIGYNAMLDIQYAHYFKRSTDNKPYCGILAGVSVGYTSSGIKGAVNDQYTTTDADGDRIDYTITADAVNATLGQLQVQIPLMFALLHKGLFFNVGPRFVIPVYSPYSQTLESPHIAAYYDAYGVTRIDNLITGRVPDDQLNVKGKWNAPTFQLYLSTEIGYEFKVGNNQSIGVGLYVDYCVYNTFKRNTEAKSLISIPQIGADPQNPAPEVKVLPAVDAAINKLGYFDVGIKVVYNINFGK